MKTAFVSGVFNVLHPGHLRLFKFAKQNAEKLIVGIESKKMIGENNVHSNKSRLDVVSKCEWVDKVVLVENNLEKIIKKIKPDIIVKGSEFKNKENVEFKYITKLKTKIIYSSGESFKYASLNETSKKEKSSKNFILDNEYIKRRNINKNNLKKIIRNFNSINLCVIGDIIVDEYLNTQALGVSKEDPTLVVTPLYKNKFIGGAGIVALHASSLGAKPSFISVIGNDDEFEYIKKSMINKKINSHFLIDKSRITTVKKRIISENKTLLRINKFDQNIISEYFQKKILSILKKNIKKLNLIVLSDFNYGCLPKKLIDDIINLANKNSVFVTADSQISSQIGDITRFHSLDLMSQTEFEIRSSLKNNFDGLVTISKHLNKITNNKNIFLKLGSEGLLINSFEKNKLDTDRIDSFNNHPVDVAGAGDSMLIVSSIARSLGATIWEAAFLGTLASAIQVSRLGNIPLTTDELINNL